MRSNQLQQLQRLNHYLNEKLKQTFEFFRELLQNRLIRLFLQALILLFSVFYLIRSYQSVDLSKQNITFEFGPIVWSFLITIGALFFGGLGWWLTLKSVGQHLSLFEAIRIHLISNLAKYIPGYAWQLLGKGYLTKKTGASTIVIGVSMTLELLQIFLTGIGLIILFFPLELFLSMDILMGSYAYLSIIKIGLFFIVFVIPVILPRITRRFNPIAAKIRINPYPLLLASFSILLGWLLFGLSFWLLGNAVQPISVEYIPEFMFTLAISFLIGLLIIVIPASIGVRESLMVFFLGNILPASIAVIIASLSRIILTICELFSAGSLLLFTKLRKIKG